MLSFDDIGAEAIPGLNLQSVSGLLPPSPAPAASSQERYSAGNSHRRVRVESVENSLSSARASPPVAVLNNVLLPALV